MLKNKSKVLILALTVVLLLSLMAMNGYSVAQKKFVMKVAYPMGITPDHPHYFIGHYLKDRIENLTEGKIEVQLFPQSQLGGDRETTEGVMNGTIEMSWPASGPMALIVPELGVLDLPYIFKDVRHAFRVLDSDFGDELARKCLAKGMRIGGWSLGGVRQIMTTKKPIYNLEDMKGLKIRVMESPTYIEMMKAWGAIPTPIAWTEVYMALSQGVVDGQETGVNAALDMKHFDIIKYVALTSEIISIRPMIISELWWQKLPLNLQEAVLKATGETALLLREKIIEFQGKAIEIAETEYNVTITKPELEPWMKATRAIYPKFAKIVGGQEIIDKCLAVE